MNYTTIDITVRPIKIAFLVDYNDKANLRKAISINSVLWGGAYNPIIPVYKRIPAKYAGPNGYMLHKNIDIVNGYIEAFDPDYVVNFSKTPDAKFPKLSERFLKESDIFDTSVKRTKARGRSEVNYGTGVFEILDYVVSKEFKYERKEPLVVSDVQYGKRYDLFFGAVFGKYNDNSRSTFLKRYKNTIGIKQTQVSTTNYFEVLQKGPTVRNLCNSYIDAYGSGGPNQDFIFLLDMNSWQDILDYWNLVATGLHVLAVPLQLCESEQAVKLSKAFIERNFRQFNENMVFYATTILKSRDCPQDKLIDFSKSVHVPPKRENQPMAVTQPWFPRMWDNWARSHDGVTGARLEHKRTTHEVTGTYDIRVPSLSPDFINESFNWWRPKYANEVSVRSFGDDDFVANVFPGDIERPDMVLGRIGLGEWRFSKRGIVYLSSHGRSQMSFTLPMADEVYAAWQQTIGVAGHTSNPGRLARQIVKKLGVDQLGLLASEEFAKLLRKLTDAKGGVQCITYDEMLGRIKRLTNNDIWYTADGYFKWILHKGIFELGTSIKCDNCNRESWHSLNELNAKVTCAICLGEIDLGLSEPKSQIKWAYRPIGPFSVPDLAQGAYTVVLALHFFTEVLNMHITPRYSFESEDGTYEADFGALVSQGWRDGEGILQLLGECKSFGKKGRAQFKDREVMKLLKLARKSGNSVLVFATLNKTLSDADKRRLSKLVLKLRDSKLVGKESIDVLILTGNELFTRRNLEECWKNLGGIHEKLSNRANYYSTKDLCDATQQIYLGVESYWDYFQRKRDEMMKKDTQTPAEKYKNSIRNKGDIDAKLINE